MTQKIYSQWKASTNERQKLQWAYAVIAGVGLVVAGLIGLVDMVLAQNLLQVVFVAAGLFVANFVAWALVRVFIDEDRDQAASPVIAKPVTKKRTK